MVACLNEVEETETFFISKVQSFPFAFNAVKKNDDDEVKIWPLNERALHRSEQDEKVSRDLCAAIFSKARRNDPQWFKADFFAHLIRWIIQWPLHTQGNRLKLSKNAEQFFDDNLHRHDNVQFRYRPRLFHWNCCVIEMTICD